MSLNKFLSIVPWAPFFSLILFIVAASFILLGIGLVVSSIGVMIAPILIGIVQVSVAGLIAVNLIFMYSVASNKMRIHNIHCAAEACRGYRIKDGAGYASKTLRCVCKMYNLFLTSLSWTSLLVILGLCVVLVWFSGCTLFVVALCELSHPAIDTFLSAAMSVAALPPAGSSPLSDFVSIDVGTTSIDICEQSAAITTGSFYLLVAAPVALLAQIIMTLSYQVVAEVSWRHLKDLKRGPDKRWVSSPGARTAGSIPYQPGAPSYSHQASSACCSDNI